MPALRVKCSLACVATFLAACATTPYRDAFPNHYSHLDKDGIIKGRALSGDVLSALPYEFQLAQLTGHLWCYADSTGSFSSLPGGSIRKARQGDDSKRLANVVALDPRFAVFKPVGYPHLSCLRPDEEVDQLFAETWFPSWLVYFNEWGPAELANQKHADNAQKLAVEIGDLQRLIVSTNAAINDYAQQVAQQQALIASVDSQIARRQQVLAATPNALALPDTGAATELPPFDPKIQYKKEQDPFYSVIEEGTQDVSSKDWSTNQMEGGKNLDAELAAKIDEVNALFADPELIVFKKIKDQVIAIKKKGFAKILTTSGARSPWRQADLYLKAKNNKNPVGKYLRSEHLFGQAADISLPVGWGWNSAEHKQLREVLGNLGIAMTVSDDPVHITLQNPSRDFYARRLFLARAYLQRAQQLRLDQQAVADHFVTTQLAMITDRAKLSADLAARKNELADKTELFAKVSALYLGKLRELQQIDAEIARREEEARKREARKNDQDRNPRPPPRRPDSETPGKPGSPRPEAPQPSKPAPSRPETPREPRPEKPVDRPRLG